MRCQTLLQIFLLTFETSDRVKSFLLCLKHGKLLIRGPPHICHDILLKFAAFGIYRVSHKKVPT